MNILDNTNQGDQIQIDENKDYFAELTAPGAKFDLSKYDNDPTKAAAAIAKGKWHADATLEMRNRQHDELRTDWLKLREEYNAGPKLKETLDQYVQELKQSQGNQQTPVQEDKSAVLDENKLNIIIQQQMQAREQLRAEETNAKTVESKLQEAYGPNYKQTVKQQIDQLGMSVEFFNDLARKHPSVLYRTLGLEGQQQRDTFQAPPTSSQRNDPFAGPVKRTNSYYQKMRQTDPVRYRDPKTQDQMYKDYMTLGEAFEDGDFHKWGHKT